MHAFEYSAYMYIDVPHVHSAHRGQKCQIEVTGYREPSGGCWELNLGRVVTVGANCAISPAQ